MSTTDTASALGDLRLEDLGQARSSKLADAATYEELLKAASAVVAVPRHSSDRAPSFVLHAPLELLARAALHEVGPAEGNIERIQRERLISLAVRYAHAGPGLPAPTTEGGGGFDKAAEALGTAISSGDMAAADRASTWLGEHGDALRVRQALASIAVLRTGAAGHTNIYTHLLGSEPNLQISLLLRGLVRELCKEPQALIEAWEPRACDMGVPEAFRTIGDTGPPPAGGIAALVRHVSAAQRPAIEGLAAATLNTGATGRHELMRLAAAQMVVGADAVVPYGWTHALTLTQGALSTVELGVDVASAVVTAATYAGSVWSSYGGGGSLAAIVDDGLAGDGGVEWAPVLHAAARSHDAHLVKYTLSCHQCAAADPAGEHLYHAATRRLHTWWSLHPPQDDPLSSMT